MPVGSHLVQYVYYDIFTYWFWVIDTKKQAELVVLLHGAYIRGRNSCNFAVRPRAGGVG